MYEQLVQACAAAGWKAVPTAGAAPECWLVLRQPALSGFARCPAWVTAAATQAYLHCTVQPTEEIEKNDNGTINGKRQWLCRAAEKKGRVLKGI